MKKTLLLAGIAASLFSANAHAVSIDLKPYVGLDYAYSDLGTKSDIDEIMETKYNSFKIDLGAKLHKNFGLETFYQQSAEESKSVMDWEGDILKTKTKFKAYGIDAIGYLPVADRVEILGAVGVAQYKFDVKFGGDYYGSGKEDNLGLRLGIGAQYNIDEHFSINGMARYIQLDDSSDDAIKDMTEFSVGVRYAF